MAKTSFITLVSLYGKKVAELLEAGYTADQVVKYFDEIEKNIDDCCVADRLRGGDGHRFSCNL
tara:strand:- start:661 stop:849 length:189 start_codon:yes stop_codon:yes gene_type:complete